MVRTSKSTTRRRYSSGEVVLQAGMSFASTREVNDFAAEAEDGVRNCEDRDSGGEEAVMKSAAFAEEATDIAARVKDSSARAEDKATWAKDYAGKGEDLVAQVIVFSGPNNRKFA